MIWHDLEWRTKEIEKQEAQIAQSMKSVVERTNTKGSWWKRNEKKDDEIRIDDKTLWSWQRLKNWNRGTIGFDQEDQMMDNKTGIWEAFRKVKNPVIENINIKLNSNSYFSSSM